MQVKINNQKYKIIQNPQPHVVIPTKKELHGWWPGKRECTAERLLINPYNGCGIGCFYCYTLAFPGYFQISRKEKIIIVAQEFDRNVSQQLDSLYFASCGYLSPVSEPFQPINEIYHLSEKIIKEFVSRNLPIEFITKAKIPQEIIELVKLQKSSFGQVSILTLNEDLRKIFVPEGASTSVLFENLERLAKEGIHAVCRIDPIFPFLTDKKQKLKELVQRAKDAGSKHIISSILDIPTKIFDEVLKKIKEYFGPSVEWDWHQLYQEKINGYLNAKISYRKRIFELLRNICEKENLTFALCMEYELKDGMPWGLNKEFSNSVNCEGINIPIYKKKGTKFVPTTNCQGNCLHCLSPACKIEELAMGRKESKKDFKLSDYRRWSKSKEQMIKF